MAEVKKIEDDQDMVSLKNLFEEESEDTDSFPCLEEVEEIIGYKFEDKSLLAQAFTDSSYDSLSYERLEYLGDSVLNLMIARDDFTKYPDLKQGKLTRLRAANVDNEKLARVAINHGLHKFVRHKRPLFDSKIQEFRIAMSQYPVHSNGLIDSPKILADIVEAMIGAIFMDTNSSLESTWKIVEPLLRPIITPATLKTHPVTKLNEMCQKKEYKIKYLDYWKETGIVEIHINKEFAGSCFYKAKKTIAYNRAANDAYNEIMRRMRINDDV